MIINGVLENVQQSAIKRERKKEEENEALICSICHYLWCKYFHYGQPQCWEETHTVSPHILIRVRSSTPLLVMDMKEWSRGALRRELGPSTLHILDLQGLVVFNHSVCPTLCNPVDCSTAGFPILHHLLELAQTYSTELVMPSNHLALCCPLLLLPSIFPSIRVFSNGSGLCSRWPKYWSFSFNISPSNEYSGLISFGINWFDLLAV